MLHFSGFCFFVGGVREGAQGQGVAARVARGKGQQGPNLLFVVKASARGTRSVVPLDTPGNVRYAVGTMGVFFWGGTVLSRL